MKEFKIVNKGDTAEIYLYDAIGEDRFWGGGISAKAFVDAVNGVKAKNIDLRVNSPGGSVFDAQTMLGALDRFKGKVTAYVDGHAASAASFLIMGASRIFMSDGAFIMIHRASAVMGGNADDMRRTAELLEKAEANVVATYQRHTKLTAEEINAMLAAETWMNAAESIEKGFAHEIVRGAKVSNYADVAPFRYRNVPELKIHPDPEAVKATEERKSRLESLLKDVA